MKNARQSSLSNLLFIENFGSHHSLPLTRTRCSLYWNSEVMKVILKEELKNQGDKFNNIF